MGNFAFLPKEDLAIFAKHPTMHRAASTTETYLAQSVNSTETDKSCSRLLSLGCTSEPSGGGGRRGKGGRDFKNLDVQAAPGPISLAFLGVGLSVNCFLKLAR